MTVVVAAEGYPDTPRSGDPVEGLAEVEEVPTAYVLHAGTADGPDGTVVSSGGRVLSVVALGGDLELHLMQTGDDPPRSAHFCIAVDGGLDELRGRIEAAQPE